MKKIYGQYFALSGGGESVLLDGHNLWEFYSEPFYCSIKAYGKRPYNIYTGNTGGMVDELDLYKFNIDDKELIIGSVEFRFNAYLFYKFDATDEAIIKNHKLTREEYFKKNPII